MDYVDKKRHFRKHFRDEKMKNIEASGNVNYDREISFTRTNPKNFELGNDHLINIEARVDSLESQIDNIEDQSRRNNLKFHGIPDTGTWETWEQSESHIRKILSDKMNIPNVENIRITRAPQADNYQDQEF